MENNKLQIKWMAEKPAPESILEFSSCNCKKSMCQTNRCNCKSLGLPCTELCGCKNCDNQKIDEDEDSNSDADDDDEVEEQYSSESEDED